MLTCSRFAATSSSSVSGNAAAKLYCNICLASAVTWSAAAVVARRRQQLAAAAPPGKGGMSTMRFVTNVLNPALLVSAARQQVT
jgi:hypothetical protein